MSECLNHQGESLENIENKVSEVSKTLEKVFFQRIYKIEESLGSSSPLIVPENGKNSMMMSCPFFLVDYPPIR